MLDPGGPVNQHSSHELTAPIEKHRFTHDIKRWRECDAASGSSPMCKEHAMLKLQPARQLMGAEWKVPVCPKVGSFNVVLEKVFGNNCGLMVP